MEKNPTNIPQRSDTALREEETLAFWKEQRIFQKTLAKKAPKGEFVFYDGPPFATGLPHYGSLLSSVIKDVIPRYKTMQGYHVERRWGWDCHGLPIENLIEKRLGLKSKKDIEKIGIDVFNEAARASVLEFDKEWERYIERIGRFVDFKNSYKTMDNSYIESVWWALKELHTKGLLYEGRKVLMYCPHCETPLSKAEVTMDDTYKDVTEETAIVKFELADHPGTFFLAWTTTPWTLPGNVALAVGPDIEYCKVKTADGTFILAKERLAEVLKDTPHEVLGTMTGKEFAGGSYKPLFDVPSMNTAVAYKVYAADFVTTGEGTGIVHIAPMYGEDDFLLGEREGLPMVQLIDSAAHYTDEAPAFIRGRYIRQAGKDIRAALEERGLLFAHAPYTHSIPHCHRCGTPLIYNAVSSWFISIQKVKDKMLSENEKVHWVPEHLKHGRFKHNLENAPDWNVSRNRFWASPLPIWKEKGGSGLMVIGSIEELKAKVKRSGNRYFVMRHGEAEHMVKGVLSTDPHDEYPLTEEGKCHVEEAAKDIPRDRPIILLASPVLRTRQTAELVAEHLGISKDSIMFDDRLREFHFGEFDGRPRSEWVSFMQRPDWYTARPEGGESFADAKVRFGQAIYEYESKYKDSTVLMVSHAIAFESLLPVCGGSCGNGLINIVNTMSITPAQVQELPFVPLPLDRKFELDLHRPYTDSIVLVDEKGAEYERIPEVVDGWVESGAMPFAEMHYPFENEREFEKRAPGDFIAEYIAQTRTWFYYMHAMGVLLFDRLAFRNVVSTGTILAADGSKMSKSKGNYTDPLVLLDRFGADALRLQLMGSVVMQSEDLQFRDDDVREAHNRVIGILHNAAKFFELYKDGYDGKTRGSESSHPLDRWVRSRLGELIREMTDSLDAYDTPSAVRPLRTFIDDYSTWYVRRSRDRVKAESSQDMQYALAVQREVLLSLSKLIAPTMPFLAETIYRAAGGEKESVHLEDWPDDISVDEKILADMAQVRAVASGALELRSGAGIKVRQPLARLVARTLPDDKELKDIVAEEVNVKVVDVDPALEREVALDTVLTPELLEEGQLRDVLRAIQALRKDEGFSVMDRPVLSVLTNAEGARFFGAHRGQILSGTGLSDMRVTEGSTAAPTSLSFPFAFSLSR